MAKFYNDTILIVHATQYDMSADGGQKATKVTYLEADYMDTDRSRGCEPRVATAPFELFEDLSVLPGVYTVRMQAGSTAKDRNGRVFTKFAPTSADLVDELDIITLLEVEPVKS